MTGSLGSVHAFSVFIAPLEASLGAARGDISLIYSFALLFLTFTVLIGHRIYGAIPPAALAAAACSAAALGLLIAAQAESLFLLGLGYSLLFGGANGVGYGFALQIVAQAMPARKGFAMGSVTAFYALGAMGFAKLFDALIAGDRIGAALAAMAGVMVAVALLSALLLALSQARYRASPPAEPAVAGRDLDRRLPLLWAGYGLGVAAGLMAIGHAAGIVAAAGGLPAQAVLGAMLIGLGNALGGFAAGWLADRWPTRRLLLVLPGISAVALIALAQFSEARLAIAGLAAVGFAYGAIIAVYPAAVSEIYGPEGSAKMYGRVFTAWGLAGLGAPWLAGVLYDTGGGYGLALVIAASAALASALAVALLPQSGGGH
jgi:OFA family oxalate/formate antiporter-like MFS transporter